MNYYDTYSLQLLQNWKILLYSEFYIIKYV